MKYPRTILKGYTVQLYDSWKAEGYTEENWLNDKMYLLLIDYWVTFVARVDLSTFDYAVYGIPTNCKEFDGWTIDKVIEQGRKTSEDLGSRLFPYLADRFQWRP